MINVFSVIPSALICGMWTLCFTYWLPFDWPSC